MKEQNPYDDTGIELREESQRRVIAEIPRKLILVSMGVLIVLGILLVVGWILFLKISD